MKLRPYQEEAKYKVFLHLARAHSTLVRMATGLGKTVLFGHVAHEWPGRVLVITAMN
jgi:superfamily II DNA or RNA helicase